MMNMIELQLGLAPPFTSRSSKSTLDLSIHSFDFLEKKMKNKKAIDSLEFADGDEGYVSSLSTQNSHGTVEDDDHGDEDSNFIKKKRNFDQAFHTDHHDAQPQTLPLLVWNKQPDDEDDRPKKNYFAPKNKRIIENDGDCAVGWPPVNSYRRKFCHQDSFPAPANYVDNTGGGGGGGGRGGGRESSSIFVKVQMEGVMITRKIDLSRHQSFETLTSCLSAMFGTGLDGYTLTYLDKDGDWLLAGDGTWREFVQSVRRLRLLRRSG